MVMTTRSELWGGGCSGPQPRPGVVPCEFIEALRASGLGRPVSQFGDPRLENPELLLLHGFQWGQDGFCARTRRPDVHQTVQYLENGGVRVITRCGSRQHEATQYPDGRTECVIRTCPRSLDLVL